MAGANKQTLLDIAEAWDKCALEIDGNTTRAIDGKSDGHDSGSELR
jgi:hypothetical protein